MIVGIDLALRNTGIVKLDDKGKFVACKLISSDPKKLNNEGLLIHNGVEMWKFLQDVAVGQDMNVGLEGLSFNSKSSSSDLIAANHWMVRCQLKDAHTTITVIPPKSWMKSIVTKEVLAVWAASHPVVRAKRGMKLTKEETQSNAKSKAAIRKLSKEYVKNAVPGDVLTQLEKYVTDNKLGKDTIYDLADAYHIAYHVYRVK